MFLRGLTDLLQQNSDITRSIFLKWLKYFNIHHSFLTLFLTLIHSQILLNNIQILNLPLILRNQHLDYDTENLDRKQIYII